MNRILKEKINRNITRIVGSYNLISKESIKKNNEINMEKLTIEIYMILNRLNEQNYFKNGYFYDILPGINTKIVHTINYLHKNKYWTIRKID